LPDGLKEKNSLAVFSGTRGFQSPVAGFTLIVAAHFLVDAYVTMLAPLMPLLSAKLGFSMAMAGIAVSIVSILSAWTQPILGLVLNRHNCGLLLPLSLIWLGGWFCLIGFAPSYFWLVLMACMGGIGSAVFHPLGAVAATATAGEKKGLFMSIYIAAGYLGISLAPLVTIPLAAGSGGLPSLALLLIPALLVGGLMCFYRPGEELFIMKKVSFHSGPRPTEGQTVEKQSQGGKILFPLILLNLLMVMRGWVSRALMVYIPFYYTFQGYDYLFTGKILSAFLFAGAVGSFLGGMVSDVMDRRMGIIVTNIIAAATLFGFFISSGPVAIILLLLTNFLLEATYPATVVLGQELLSANAVLATGMMFGLAFGMGGVSAAVTGILAEIWGLTEVLRAKAWILLCAGLLAFFLPRKLSTINSLEKPDG